MDKIPALSEDQEPSRVLEINRRISAGFLFALASAAMFAVRPVLVKLVYAEGVDSTTLIAIRMAFSLPIYLVLLIYFLHARRKRHDSSSTPLTPKLLGKIAAVGIMGYYSASFLDLLGLQYVTAQLGRMILYSYPTMVVLLGGLFFAQKITPAMIVSLLVTYAGIALIFGHDLQAFGPEVKTGAFFITLSALSFAIYLLFAKDLIEKVGAQIFTCLALSAASIAILIHFSMSHGLRPIGLNQTATLLILGIAIFCTVIPSFFTAAAVARIGSDKTGVVATVGPAVTSIAAVMVLGEAFTIYHLLGMLITISGVWILRKR